MSDRKRPTDDASNGSNKKLKSDISTNGSSSATGALTGADLIAQKRAEIAAKVANMKNAAFGLTGNAAASSIQKLATAAAKVPTPMITPPKSNSPAPPAGVSDDVARRVVEAKRRVAEAQTKLAGKDNPYMTVPQLGRKKSQQPPAEPVHQGVGLNMAAHPLLLDQTPSAPQSKKDRYKPMQPKFASIRANIRTAPATPTPPPMPVSVETTSNPYASTAPPSKDTGFEGAPRERSGRQFRFITKGKYVSLGNQMRHDIQLEELKQRIAESAKKAGLDSDMSIERTVKRAVPPDVEWWDVALLPNKTYGDVDRNLLNIRTPDSPITIYIQHPIPIPAPGDKNKVALKPLKLTTKEQKKMRKLRRASELQDKRDRIRMGLLPPDPPKVRLSNLMRVLTSDAVQDPTRIEARVRREVAMRKHGHDKMNAERKLTDEQRREKIENKKHEEEKKGLYGAVFKVKKLTDPAHQFKVRKNAEQLSLTGICIFNPNFSLVYVEGAQKFIRKYKRLMLHRIGWTEAARPRGSEPVEIQENEGEDETETGDISTAANLDGEEELVTSLENNNCFMVWEGALRDRAFNNFRAKSSPTDAVAKELLGDRLKGYWDQAKNWKPEEEELF